MPTTQTETVLRQVGVGSVRRATPNAAVDVVQDRSHLLGG